MAKKIIKIAYLGPDRTTYTGRAAWKAMKVHSDKQRVFVPFQPIRSVVRAVDSGMVDYGVVPLENFHRGDVRETLDSLTESERTRIISEESIRVVHRLGLRLGDDTLWASSDRNGYFKLSRKLKYIISKAEALEQCSEFISRNFPRAILIPVASTGEAVRRLEDREMKYAAAIAPEETVNKYCAVVAGGDLCPNNKTRFAVLSRGRTDPTGDDKTLIAIHPEQSDKPGVLADILGIFRLYQINLEMVQSRPDRDLKNPGYHFYLELQGHEKDEGVRRAIGDLRYYLNPEEKNRKAVKVLGSYRNTHWKEGM